MRVSGRVQFFILFIFISSYLTAGSVLSQQVAPPGSRGIGQTSDAAISGTIVDAISHQPVIGATVSVRAQAGGPERFQLTDAKGRFVFAALPQGNYSVTVTCPGFADERLGFTPLGGAGRITIEAGEWFQRANFSIMPLASLGGRVADETGQPSVGTYVRLIRLFNLSGAERLAAGPVTTTDDRGEYRFSGVPPGSYLVAVPSVQQGVRAGISLGEIQGLTDGALSALDRATKSLGRPATSALRGGVMVNSGSDVLLGNYPTPPELSEGSRGVIAPTFYPAATSISAAVRVTASAGRNESGLDIVLRAERGFRVCGRVVSPDGASTRSMLRLMPNGTESLGTGSEAATAPIGDDGSFCFERVPTGEYVLSSGSVFEFSTARSESSGSASTATLPRTPGMPRTGQSASGVLVSGAPGIVYATHLPSTIEGNHASVVRQEISVGAGDINDLVVPVVGTGAVEGRLVFQDVNRRAAAGSAELAAVDGNPALGARFAALNEAGDGFVARSMAPGAYALRFPSADLTVVSIVADGQDVTSRAIQVRPSTSTSVVVTLSGRPTTVSGLARSPTGMPVSAVVLLYPTDRSLWTGYGFTPTWIRSAPTTEGRFEVRRVRPGEYFIVAVDAADGNRWSDPGFLASAVASAVRVSVNLGAAVRQDLTLHQR